MPFLRFTRDRRGYETTALLQSSRRQGRGGSRILYWFRGPVDVKVGRSPIDEEAIRLIEEHHPNVSFDWPKILGGHEEEREETRPARRPGQRERPSGSRRGRRPEAPGRPEAAPRPQAASDETEEQVPPDQVASEQDAEPAPTEPQPRATAAHEAFSPENLARLSARYAAVRARIDEEIEDAAQAERLREIAEALNPDCWVTPEDVRVALERYEQVYRELREALGPRRKRRAPPTSSGPAGPDAD